MLPRSIKWQTQIYYSLLIISIVFVLVFGFYEYEKKVKLEQIDAELTNTLMSVIPAVLDTTDHSTYLEMFGRRDRGRSSERRSRREGDGPRDEEERSEARRPRRMHEPLHDSPQSERRQFSLAVIGGKNDRYFVTAWTSRERVQLLRTENWPAIDEELIAFTSIPMHENEYQWVDGHRLTTHHVPSGLIVTLGIPKDKIEEELRGFAIPLFGAGAVISVIGILLGYWILHRGLKPIDDISNTAIEISEGDLTQRIKSQGMKRELDVLAGVLNRTFERLHASIQQQVRFNADASHELRTPLAIILADCDFSLKKERPSERYLKTVKVCRKTAMHMKTLVEELSLLSKGDSAAFELELVEEDLGDLVSEIIFMTEPLMEEKQLRMECDVNPAPGRFDFKSLKQVIVNLVGNAVHYNKEGGAVRLRCGQAEGKVYLEVEDTGIGIADEEVKHIFDRFYRSDRARTYAEGRTGLGLAITKMIVEAHRGTITVKSELGQGTCFRMEFPGVG